MDAIAKIRPLGSLKIGEKGRVVGLDMTGLPADLEARMLRMGIDEDAPISVVHEGPVHRDPLAVKVDGVLLALRRREAAAILVEVDHPQ